LPLKVGDRRIEPDPVSLNNSNSQTFKQNDSSLNPLTKSLFAYLVPHLGTIDLEGSHSSMLGLEAIAGQFRT
jgi:hypothetical protein